MKLNTLNKSNNFKFFLLLAFILLGEIKLANASNLNQCRVSKSEKHIAPNSLKRNNSELETSSSGITSQQKDYNQAKLESKLFIENKGQFNANGETNPILFQCDADGYRIAISNKGSHYYFIQNESINEAILPVISQPLRKNSTFGSNTVVSNYSENTTITNPLKEQTNLEIKTTAYRVDLSLHHSSSPKKITKENPSQTVHKPSTKAI